ncbi:cation channel sperm-associated auxiliary subunit zeta [Lepus europaeus]|uniref:cation channel sperm-associated auxiliary subunit zeta n=1 Tax=Lepus europaeus TaxID=9983 RepID=UPI002B45FBB0|nr:cation channel sperm-associated auxiliary subunit zeta [Lepus europaeus]
MEEKPFKVSVKPPERRSSGQASPHDIRNLWTTATLSQSQLNLPLAELCESFEEEGGAVRHAAAAWHSPESRWELGEQGAALADGASVESGALDAELRRESSLESCLEEGDDESKTTTESSLVSVLRVSKHTPHRAYWTEQQNRLPLPLMGLMENEALEILTKALHSYRREIGRGHFLTKELRRYIEGLKRRRGKRFQVSAN